MKRLYFIRHGLSVNNELGIFSGLTETPLSDTGRKQVREAAEQIKHLNIDVIVSSPMSRTKETAEIISDIIGYPKEKILINLLLAERNFGALEGTKYDKSKVQESVKNIEPVEEVLARALKGLEYVKSLNANNILIVSHGAIGRGFRFHTLGLPYDQPPAFGNAEVVKLI